MLHLAGSFWQVEETVKSGLIVLLSKVLIYIVAYYFMCIALPTLLPLVVHIVAECCPKMHACMHVSSFMMMVTLYF